MSGAGECVKPTVHLLGLRTGGGTKPGRSFARALWLGSFRDPLRLRPSARSKSAQGMGQDRNAIHPRSRSQLPRLGNAPVMIPVLEYVCSWHYDGDASLPAMQVSLVLCDAREQRCHLCRGRPATPSPDSRYSKYYTS